MYSLIDFWCVFSVTIIRIYIIDNLWKSFKKKTANKRKLNFFPIFRLKIDFYRWKIFFVILNRVNSDRSHLDLSDEAIRIQNFHFNLKLWRKNCWKLPKLLPCRKVHSFQVPISYTFREMRCQRAMWSGRAGSDRFIVLNDSASPKMVIKIYLNIFRFF